MTGAGPTFEGIEEARFVAVDDERRSAFARGRPGHQASVPLQDRCGRDPTLRRTLPRPDLKLARFFIIEEADREVVERLPDDLAAAGFAPAEDVQLLHQDLAPEPLRSPKDRIARPIVLGGSHPDRPGASSAEIGSTGGGMGVGVKAWTTP